METTRESSRTENITRPSPEELQRNDAIDIALVNKYDKLFTYFDEDDIRNNVITEEYDGAFAGEETMGDVTIVTGSSGTDYQTDYFQQYFIDDEEDDNTIFSVIMCSSSYDGVDHTPEYINYRRFASLLLNDSNEKFKTSDGTEIDEMVVIAFARNHIKEGIRVLNGYTYLTWNSSNQYELGAKIVDDEHNSMNIINGDSYYLTTGTPANDGIIIPDLGLILININADTLSYDNINNKLTELNIQSKERINSITYFCRLKNKKYNYSNNPTWSSGSNHVIANEDMWGTPTTYVTTVGLYDAYNNLIAVGKLNKPIQKTFEKELSIRVQLKF